MRAAQRFEDLECCQLAKELTNAIYAWTARGRASKDYGFVDEIRRAAVSVMNNIAEGHERGSNKDFVKFLYIARGSAGEVRNMLYIGCDQGYLDPSTLDQMKRFIRTNVQGLLRPDSLLQHKLGHESIAPI